MNKQKTLIFSLSALLFIATSFIAYSWTEPTTPMPSGYTAPLNTSATAQNKVGELGAASFVDADDSNYYINPSGNSVVSGTITAANPTEDSHIATKGYVDSNGGSPAISKYFGSGIDGDVTISTNTTLTKDMEYKNLTIKSGAVLNPNGWRVFVSNILTIESGGKISRDGITEVWPLTGLPTNRVGGGAPGGRCYYTNHSGSISYNYVNGADGEFGAGGAGGQSISSIGVTYASLGGAGGNTNIVLREYIDPPSQSQLALLPTLTLAKLGGAGGGGGGREYGYNDYVPLNYGGSGGGVAHIFVKTLINNGTISARGGAGADGITGNVCSLSSSNPCRTSSPGGGGGGGGGYILLVYNTKTGTGTLDVSGGEGGVGAGSSANGQNGGAGIISEYQVDF